MSFSYNEFTGHLSNSLHCLSKDADNNLVTISGPYSHKEVIEKQLQVHFSHLKVITVLSEEVIAFIKEAEDNIIMILKELYPEMSKNF